MESNMTKQFKINPDLTCPELAGYRLPSFSRSQEDDAEIEYPTIGHEKTGIYKIHKSMQAGYNKAREKYEFTESQIRQAILFGSMRSKLTPNELELSFNQLLSSLRTPRTPIAIEVEMVVGDGFIMQLPPCKHCLVPATNPDGTVKGRYIYGK